MQITLLSHAKVKEKYFADKKWEEVKSEHFNTIEKYIEGLSNEEAFKKIGLIKYLDDFLYRVQLEMNDKHSIFNSFDEGVDEGVFHFNVAEEIKNAIPQGAVAAINVLCAHEHFILKKLKTTFFGCCYSDKENEFSDTAMKWLLILLLCLSLGWCCLSVRQLKEPRPNPPSRRRPCLVLSVYKRKCYLRLSLGEQVSLVV